MAVTSVALADGSATPIYAISGSPVTGAGTLTFALETQSAKQVFAGPTTGLAAQPTFRALVATDLPANSANPSATIGLAAVNGTATTWMTSDSAPPLSQAISPTWTGSHTFTPSSGIGVTINANSGSAAIQLNQTVNAFVAGYNTAGTTRTGYLDFIGGASGGGGATETILDNDGTTVNDWLSLVSGGIRRVRVDGIGQVTINTPTSGTALTVNGDVVATTPSSGNLVSNGGWEFNADATASTGTVVTINTTTSAATGLHIVGNFASGFPTGMTIENQNNGSGSTAICVFDMGDANNNAITISFQGSGNTSSDFTGAPAGLLGIVGTNTAVPLCIATDGAQRIGITSGGAVHFNSIGTTASAANAFLDSTNTNNLLRSTSSRRYKRDIEIMEYERAARIVEQLSLVQYHSLATADDPRRLHYGLVAEDVAEIDPSLVTFDEEGRPDGVQYERVAMMMLPLVQHLLNR